MKILLVDDDEYILHGYHRNLRNTFDLEVAMGGAQALLAMENHGPFAVIVADMRMPGMSGLEVLQEAQRLSPDTTRVMLTGNVDQQTAVDAVNQGQVFRFLSKPCPPQILALTIHAAIRQHQLVTAEKELLNQTLMGSLQVFMDLLANLDPESFGRGKLLRERAILLARRLDYPEVWDLEMASLLLPVGRLALPPELLAKLKHGTPLEPRERTLLDRVPESGARLLQNIPRLQQVAQIIRSHARDLQDSSWTADPVHGEPVPLGARILRVVHDFTLLEQQRQSRAVALAELALHPEPYDPRVLQALFAQFGPDTVSPAPAPVQERTCPLAELQAGMVLTQNVTTEGGRLVLMAGIEVGAAHLELLHGVAELLELQEPIYIQHA